MQEVRLMIFKPQPIAPHKVSNVSFVICRAVSQGIARQNLLNIGEKVFLRDTKIIWSKSEACVHSIS